MMSVELFIALRYIKGRKKNIFGILTTIIGIGGICIGVAALIVTLAVMNGFHKDIKEKILGLSSHIIILGTNIENPKSVTDRLYSIKEIDAISPFVYGQAIIKTRNNVSGVLVKGINFSEEIKVIPLNKLSFNGDWSKLKEKGIVLGKELIKNLSAKINDDLILVSPNDITFPGMYIPKLNKFKIIGVLNSGMYDYDTNLVFIDIENAKKFFSIEGVSGFDIKLKNIDKTETIAEKIRNSINFRVLTWQDLNRNLFAALKLEKVVMFILLTLIIIVACFNIISNLLLLTIEKAKEIGILSALGMNRNSIRKIFLYEGLYTGILGVFLGTFVGIFLSVILKKYQFIKLPPDIYYIDKLPVDISIQDVIIVVVLTLFITVLSTFYPANKASKINPVEVIRYG